MFSFLLRDIRENGCRTGCVVGREEKAVIIGCQATLYTIEHRTGRPRIRCHASTAVTATNAE